MARIEKIKTKVDLLGFIYDPQTLPTAIIKCSRAEFSVHGIREGGQGLLEEVLKQGEVTVDKDGYLSEEAKAYRFWDEYPEPGHVCFGVYFEAKTKGAAYKFRDIEDWGVKTFAMCA